MTEIANDNSQALAPPTSGPVLLYDGVCALCNNSVKLILRFEKSATMRFAALDSDYARDLVERHPWLAGADTMVVVDDPGQPGERLHVESDGWLRVIEYLGGSWRVFLLARLIPRPVRNALYGVVARTRYRVFGKYDTCPVPPPQARARFLP